MGRKYNHNNHRHNHYCSLLLTLPNEILQHIINHLYLIDIINLHKCCRRLRDNIDIGKYVKLNKFIKQSVDTFYTYIRLDKSTKIKHGKYICNIYKKEMANYRYGKLHGRYIKYKYDNTTKIICNYNNDMLNGLYNKIKHKHVLRKQYNYVNDIRHGEYKVFIHGCLRYSGFYSNGFKHSMINVYNIFNNQEITTVFDHEYTDKVRYIYYKNTVNIYKRIEYDNRRRIFSVCKYGYNGVVRDKYSYKYINNYKHIIGTRYKYYKSGGLFRQINYVNGIKHGQYIMYCGKNRIDATGFYHYGNRHSKWVYYDYDTGKIWYIERFHKGQTHGLCEYYNNGIKIIDKLYEYNKLVKIIKYDINR